MGRISPAKYTVFLAVLILVLGGVGLAKGGLYLDMHEGDAAHMIDILLRMGLGLVPHLDFSTPIGIFAFLPIRWMMNMGFGIGQAFIAAQILIAVLFAPPVARVALSRLSGLAAWGFGAVAMVIVLGLVHGENATAISVSMYYNRWAWVAAFIAILLAVLPERSESKVPLLDGVIAGAMLAFMALIKPTYFVGFVLPVALGFMLRGAWRSLLAGLVTGLSVALAMVAFYGTEFFPAYVADLLSVTRSESRAAPGVSFVEVLNAPRFLIGTVTLFLSVIVLRQAGRDRVGLLLLLLAPGFVYVTYQNFGNDPQWLILLCVLLLAERPERGRRVLFNSDARNATSALALMAFALIAPSMQNIATSPFRNLVAKTEDHVPQFEGRAELDDLFVTPRRTRMVLARENLVDRYPELAPYASEDEEFAPVSFLGETLPRCALQGGDLVLNGYMADRLKAAPFNFPPESQFFVADIVSAIWILGDFAPLKGGAPWYYSGAPGVENADAIIVPLCPLDPSVERHALAAVEAEGLKLRPPLRDPMMLVYPIVKE
jgi:hypothetical protein